MGVIVEEHVYTNVVQPKILAIKSLLADDPDELPVLHREEIINKIGCFNKLNNAETKEKYDAMIVDLVQTTNYSLCCVVLDKKTHLQKYNESAFHPYHYCLNVLLERYTFFLEERAAHGDVVAEARGKDDDKELRKAYEYFYENGTYFRPRHLVQERLSSRKIKIKDKEAGICGLEFADLLALAGKLDTLFVYGAIPSLSENFLRQLVGIIQPKYRVSSAGQVKGFGKKLIK